MHHFPIPSSNQNSPFYPTKNPSNLHYLPPPSTPPSPPPLPPPQLLFSLPSHTARSIPQPPPYSPLLPLKPTYPPLSPYPLLAFPSSLHQIPPITPTLQDNPYLLQPISPIHPIHPTSP
ncbi:amidase family protein, partial [Bacillus mycoides]|uniref:amidase family protein n=1 Tax=Bacillus mycoides TaxID=1405 RepID=UPI003CC80CCF